MEAEGVGTVAVGRDVVDRHGQLAAGGCPHDHRLFAAGRGLVAEGFHGHVEAHVARTGELVGIVEFTGIAEAEHREFDRAAVALFVRQLELAHLVLQVDVFAVELFVVVEEFHFQPEVVFGRAEHEFDGTFGLDGIVEVGGLERELAVVGAHHHDLALGGNLTAAVFRAGLYQIVAGRQAAEIEGDGLIGGGLTLGDHGAAGVGHGPVGLDGVGGAVER